MNRTPVLRRLSIPAIGLFVVSALLSMMPVATAAPGDFPASFSITGVIGPPGALEADGVAGTITVHWIYQYPNSAVTASGIVAAATTLHFQPVPTCGGNGFLLTGATAIPITITPPGTGTSTTAGKVEQDSTFHIQATSDAPGETPVTCSFTAFVDAWGPNNDVPQTGPSTNTVPVIAAYHGLVGANVPITIDEAGPQKTINYAIHLTNLGNSRTFVNFNVVELHTADGWNPVAPGQISLESKNQAGTQTTADANFLISTPYKNGWNNKESTFQLKIQPQSTKNPALIGNEITVNILARVRGIYVPGPDPMLMVGAILGTALLVRLRKNA